MWASAKAVLGLLISVVIVYLILNYGAQIPTRQSMVLAVLFGMLFQSANHAAAKPTLRSMPYWVRTIPKWYEIFTDFKLLQNPEDWSTVRASGESVERGQFSVFRDPLWFSVVQRSADGEQTLIYLNSYKSFVSEIDLREDLDIISIIDEKEGYHLLRNEKVRFFAKYGGLGYEIGLELPDWWWDKNKASCPPVVSETKEYSFGTVRVALAVIPYREFDVYWQPVSWSKDFMDRVDKTQEEHRKKFGWVAETVGEFDVPIDWPTEINNKYFTVQHNDV
jgi:hypothetical protein